MILPILFPAEPTSCVFSEESYKLKKKEKKEASKTALRKSREVKPSETKKPCIKPNKTESGRISSNQQIRICFLENPSASQFTTKIQSHKHSSGKRENEKKKRVALAQEKNFQEKSWKSHANHEMFLSSTRSPRKNIQAKEGK